MAANGDQERNEQPQPQGNPAGGGGFTMSGKMLGIAGGGAAALVVVIVVVVLLVTGVFGGGGGGASGGRDVLAYIPGDTEVIFLMDNEAILNGDVPEDYIEWLEEDDEDSDDFGVSSETYGAFEILDIDDDDVAFIAFAVGRDGDHPLAIMRGDFQFDVIREELEDGLDCEDDDYRGFELWECQGQEYPAVALFEKDGYIVMAIERQDDLEDMLTLKSRTPEKLADAEESEIKRLLDQTSGWQQIALLGDNCLINRCEGLAVGLGKNDGGADVPASYALLFSSERAATAAEVDVAIDDLVGELFAGMGFDLNIGDVKADGEFVIGTGTAEFVDPDDASSRSSNENNESGGRRGSGAARAPTATEAPRAVAAPRLAQAQPAAPARSVPTEAPWPTEIPARQQQAPAPQSEYHSEWMDSCLNNDLVALSRQECNCVYDYLQDEGLSPVPLFGDIDWWSLFGPGSAALNWCTR